MNRIRRGKSSSGQPIIEIVNWSRHQRVDKPQDKSALPPIAPTDSESVEIPTECKDTKSFANHSRMVRESFAPRSTIYDHGATTDDQGEGSEKTTTNALPFLSDEFKMAWDLWHKHRLQLGRSFGGIEAEANLLEITRVSKGDESEAIAIIEFSIRKGAKNLILDGSHRPSRHGLTTCNRIDYSVRDATGFHLTKPWE